MWAERLSQSRPVSVLVVAAISVACGYLSRVAGRGADIYPVAAAIQLLVYGWRLSLSVAGGSLSRRRLSQSRRGWGKEMGSTGWRPQGAGAQ